MDHIDSQDIARNLAHREQTREALARKLETLETRMLDTIEQVKESVRQSTDLKYQVSKRPWVMFGLSVVVGSLAGRLFMSRRQSFSARSLLEIEDIIRKASDSTRKSFDTLGENINLDQYAKNFSVLKNASISAMTSIAAEVARRVVPAIITQIDKYSKSKNFNSASKKVRDADDQIKDRFSASVE
ncbi:MAG: hypothetical protein ABIP88_04205 [Candidatus Binatia bacterium]